MEQDTLESEYGIDYDWSGTYDDGDGGQAYEDTSGGIDLGDDGDAVYDPTPDVDVDEPSDRPDADPDTMDGAVQDEERASDAWQDVSETEDLVDPDTGESVRVTDDGSVVDSSSPTEQAQEAVNNATDAIAGLGGKVLAGLAVAAVGVAVAFGGGD